MKKGSTGYLYFEARDTSGERKSGLTVTCVTSLDGAAPVAGPTVSEIGTTGVYCIELSASLTNGKTLAVIPSATDAIIPLIQVDFDTYLESASEIASSVWSNSNRTLTSDSSAPTASEVATAVWSSDSRTLTGSVSLDAQTTEILTEPFSDCTLSGSTFTIPDSTGTSAMTFTVERDDDGNITRIY